MKVYQITKSDQREKYRIEYATSCFGSWEFLLPTYDTEEEARFALAEMKRGPERWDPV